MTYEVSKHRLIYIFAIDDDAHKGLLKIGETTFTGNDLDAAARKRINQYTRTAGIPYKLLHTELAVTDKNISFRDYDVHRLLKKYRSPLNKSREWFRVDLATAKQAIAAVKQGKKFLHTQKNLREEIDFRPEQLDAINQTVDYFKADNKFLWNAKMRFGKTLCALQVVKEMNFAKTIIITHRPVVDAAWYDDFNKIFGDANYIYGNKGSSLESLLADGRNFVYFASLQDLRGSQTVNDKSTLNKNAAVFKTRWDCVIVDEAHEGTKTALGDAVIKNLVKKNSKFLALSGTPFNLLDDFAGDNVYTWDYVMEQRAKAAWDKNHFDDSNPYDELPRMNIFTYNLGKLFNYVDAEDISFSFREFFRTDGDNFVHADDVKSFLNLLVKEDDNNYPFSRADFREMFKHTLWIIPGVKEGLALSKLLKSHEVFKHFEIVNVAGNGDSDDEPEDALTKVRDAITDNDYTITLSCGKLTAGVTVPEWTAVFMLAGSYSTSAANYLQTIFRVQSPCNRYGVSKRNCYVFDFAPDRALKMIADSVKVSARAGHTQNSQRENLNALLKFCPVIAVEGSDMKTLDANKLLQRIKLAQAERAVRNGFEDTNLYNDTLRDLSGIDLKKFETLKKIIGTAKPAKKLEDIPVNAQGLTEEKRDALSKTRRQLSPEEKEAARRAAVKRNAILILRGISIRMPLLIYGADVPVDEDITIENFAAIVDDVSWAEFMPAGVTKELFKEFIAYYDPEVFIKAGHIIRQRAKDADKLNPAARIDKIAALFATFKNPDKETVLTPFNVVMLHIDSAFDKNFFTPDKKILDINAKTGLYPLYVACKIYRARLGSFSEDDFKPAALLKIWDKTVAENIFVICKTPMAKAITRRTLVGFREEPAVNAHCFDDLINLLKINPAQFLEHVTDKKFWNKGVGKMFFDGVVGNPPYQVVTESDSTRMLPIYHEFIKIAYNDKLTKRASLIHPARFLFNAGYTPKDFNEKFLHDEHVKIVKYFSKSQDVFQTSDIKGGVAITLFDADENFGAIDTFTPFEELNFIHKKVVRDKPNFRPFSEIIRGQMTYKLSAKAYEDFPDLSSRVSERNDTALRTNAFEIMPDIFLEDKPDDEREYFKMLGKVGTERVYRFVRREYMIDIPEFKTYKVFVPASNGSGALGEVLSTPLVGLPLVGATQTFITVGAFATRAEADACIAYIKSKFCRVMLGILKVTQHNPPATWAMVPLQDFTASSDIDWRVSIPEIDAQLYRKYNLSAAEIKFIDSHVREMT